MTYAPRQGEYFRIGRLDTYATVDILLRQTADRPIAARHVHACYFRNSVLALRTPDGFSVEYLLGVLNSNTAAKLFQMLVAESGQRAFPQVKVRALRRLPIPDPGQSPDTVAEIERLVRQIEAGGPLTDDTASLTELNQVVAGLYGVDAKDT